MLTQMQKMFNLFFFGMLLVCWQIKLVPSVCLLVGHRLDNTLAQASLQFSIFSVIAGQQYYAKEVFGK